MSSSASGTMSHMGNMSGLAACSVSDSKPLQFPLAQRRKRRVLFTQAQVGTYILSLLLKKKHKYLPNGKKSTCYRQNKGKRLPRPGEYVLIGEYILKFYLFIGTLHTKDINLCLYRYRS